LKKTLLFLILFLSVFLCGFATDYYVKNGGNDGAAGTSDGTAWETIAKVNSMMGSFSPGDNIYFKRGSTWSADTLEIECSGSSGSIVKFGAYGTGNLPVISAFTTTGADTWGNMVEVGALDVYRYDSSYPTYICMEGTTFLTYLLWDTDVSTTFNGASQGSWSRNGNYTYVCCTDNADPDTHTMYIPYSNTSPAYSCIWLYNDVKYVTVENLELKGANQNGIKVRNWGTNDSNNIILSGLTVRYCGTTGIQICNDSGGSTYKVTNVTVQNCLSSYNAYHGIALLGRVENITVTGNTVHHTGWDREQGIDTWGGHGISMYGSVSDRAPTNCIIEKCEVYNIYEESDGGEGTGIQFDDNTNYCTIRYNHIHNCEGAGILYNGPNNTSYYNIIDTCYTGVGTYGAGIYFLNGNGGSAHNNVVYNCKNGITFAVESGETVTIRNNLVFESDVYDFRWIWSSTYGTVNSNNNCIYNSTIALNFLDWHLGSGDEQDLAEWQTDTGQDANSTDSDPSVVNAAGGNFHLSSDSSPCYEAGTDVSLTPDYDGVTVPQGTYPEIGAFEYTGGGNQPDFPNIYIDSSYGDGGVGSQADPYNDLSDINWTTGGDNSIYDYYAGSPTASVKIYSKRDGLWREMLITGCSGTETYPIIITSYGSGDNPLILGSTDADIAGSWSRYDSQNILHAGYFEDNDLSEWDSSPAEGSSTIAADAMAKNVGSYGMKIVLAADDDAYVHEANAFANQTEAYVRFYINFQATSLAASEQIILAAGYNDTQSELTWYVSYFESGGTEYLLLSLLKDDDSYDTSIVWACSSIIDQAWHEIKVRWKAGAGADGGGQLWVDGTSRGSVFTLNANDGRTGDYLVGGYLVGANSTATLYFDDIIAATSDIMDIIWKTANGSYTIDPSFIFYDTNATLTRATAVETFAELTTNWYWWYDSGNDFVALCHNAGNPAGQADGIEIPKRHYGVFTDEDYITVDGIDFKYVRTSATASGANGSYLTVQNCDIQYCSFAAYVDGGYATITNNTINHLYPYDPFEALPYGAIGICFWSGNNTASYNTIQNCDIDGTFGHAFEINASSRACNGNKIHHNYVNNTFIFLECIGTLATDQIHDAEIYYNISYNTPYFLSLHFDDDPIGYPADIDNLTAYNNTHHDPLTRASNAYGPFLILGTPIAEGLIIKNNIVYAWKVDYIYYSNPGTFTITHTNNCYYRVDSGSTQLGITLDGTEFESEPLLTDPANGDFTLQSISPCIDAGTDVGLTEDYEGNHCSTGKRAVSRYRSVGISEELR